MGIVTAEELYAHVSEDAAFLHNINVCVPSVWNKETPRIPDSFTMEDVEKFLDEVHGLIADGIFLTWKAMRPWDIVNLNESLDATKVWIGWEIETGWRTLDARKSAISDLLSSYNHVALDDEGPCHGAEMTWSPANEGKYEGEHPLLYVAGLADKYEVYRHDPEDCTGTHVNISTPTIRDMGREYVAEAVNAMNHGLHSLDDNQREELFGRPVLYGGFFGREGYVEGKLFNTTYDKEEAKVYISVASRLSDLLESLAKFVLSGSHDHNKVRIDNFYQAMKGADPVFNVTSRSSWAEEHDIGKDWYDDDEYDHDDYDDDDDDGWY